MSKPQIKYLIILGVLIMSFLVGYLVLAWTEPPLGPEFYNVPAPLNVGSGLQRKAGGLNIGPNDRTILTGEIAAQRYCDNDNPTACQWYIDPANSGYAGLFSGSVGIGTTSPGAKLHVDGEVRATGPIRARYGSGSNVVIGDDLGVFDIIKGTPYLHLYAEAGYIRLHSPLQFLGGDIVSKVKQGRVRIDIPANAGWAGYDNVSFGITFNSAPNVYLTVEAGPGRSGDGFGDRNQQASVNVAAWNITTTQFNIQAHTPIGPGGDIGFYVQWLAIGD